LIKPLNPNQILLSVKKILENKRIVTERTNIGYQQDFRNISMAFSEYMDHREWAEMYKKLLFWDLAMDSSQDKGMSEVLENQKSEANNNFSKFVIENYESWLHDPEAERPTMSHQLMKKHILP